MVSKDSSPDTLWCYEVTIAMNYADEGDYYETMTPPDFIEYLATHGCLPEWLTFTTIYGHSVAIREETVSMFTVLRTPAIDMGLKTSKNPRPKGSRRKVEAPVPAVPKKRGA